MRVKSDDSGKFLYCLSCHAKEPLTEEIVLESPIENKNQEITVVSESEEESFPVTNALCPKCEEMRESFWTIQQTRGGDEPPTRFYQCKTCNWRWREYS